MQNPPNPLELLVSYFPFVILAGVAYYAMFAKRKPRPEISCPKCNALSELGRRPTNQIVCSIMLFPIGLLALIAGRNPTECRACGYRWMA